MKNTTTAWRKMTERITFILSDYLDHSIKGEGHVLHQEAYQSLADQLNLEPYIREGGLDIGLVDKWLMTYLEHTQHMHHPHYMGHQVAVPHLGSGIADMIHGVVNNPMAIYEMGPSAAVIEQVVVNWMLEKVGWFQQDSLHELPMTGAGVLTSGGSMANLTAMLAARAAAVPESWEKGAPDNLVVIGSDVAHYSIMRAISIMGMGKDAFITVQTDDNEVLLADDLDRAFRVAQDKGQQVMAVVANACATSTGLYDPIDEIADFCNEKHLWFHVDGAHGASALISHKHRSLMKGVEKATSLIWDTHKVLRTTTLCAAVLFKDKHHMHCALQQKGSYLFHDKEQPGFDLMPYTIECTKAGLGTKLFWVLATEGEKAMEEFVHSRYQLAMEFYKLLVEQDDFYCPYVPEANILCFQFSPLAESNASQLALRNLIIKRGNYYITSTEVNGKRLLRCVLLNPHTTMDHLDGLISEIRLVGNILLQSKEK